MSNRRVASCPARVQVVGRVGTCESRRRWPLAANGRCPSLESHDHPPLLSQVINQIRSGQVRSGQFRSVQVRSVQFSSGQVGPGQVRSGQVRSGRARSGQVRWLSSGTTSSHRLPPTCMRICMHASAHACTCACMHACAVQPPRRTGCTPTCITRGQTTGWWCPPVRAPCTCTCTRRKPTCITRGRLPV